MNPLARAHAAAEWRLERMTRTARALGDRIRPRRNAKRMGLRLALDMRDNTQRLLYREGAYEPNLNRLITDSLRPGDVYVDIGAHIGIHALPAAQRLQRLGAGHVYAFEPTDSADRLAEAAHRNAIRNLTLIRTAVGQADGTLQMRTDPAFGRDDSAVRSAFGPGRVIGEFPVIRFDEWAHELARLDIVKIDVEGSEIDVIAGMRGTLTRLRPRLIAVEENEQALQRAGHTPADLYRELADVGYEPVMRVVDHGTVLNVAFAHRTSS